MNIKNKLSYYSTEYKLVSVLKSYLKVLYASNLDSEIISQHCLKIRDFFEDLQNELKGGEC